MSKLDEARERLHHEWLNGEYRADLEQAARDFAAAEIDVSAYEEILMCDSYWRQFKAWLAWLRAGGLAQKKEGGRDE